MSDDALVAQLEAGLDRERRARRQAEVIAERGMRELWDINRQLKDSVTARTAQVERVLAGLDRTAHSWAEELSASAREISDRLQSSSESDELRRLLERMSFLANLMPRRNPRPPATVEPVVVADEILHRWQRRADVHGQLLSIEADTTTRAVTADWYAVFGVAGLMLATFVNERGHGALVVELACVDEVVLRVCHDDAQRDDADAEVLSFTPDRFDVALSVARRVVESAGGSVDASLDEVWAVEVRMPILD